MDEVAGSDSAGDMAESNGSRHERKITRYCTVRGRDAKVEEVAYRAVHEGVGFLG